MIRTKGGLLRSAAFLPAIALLTPFTAFAQDSDPAPEQTAPVSPDLRAPNTPPPADEGTIMVTGSRIKGGDVFRSPSPISIVDPELSKKMGLIDTAAMIQGSPIASGSSQITSAISSNFVTNGGSGAQTISLRGLGAERTLVLLNGRRAGPAGTRGGVSSFDLNVLPSSIMERVDILKDGASSIYGSDAVAGVVNLITKTDTNGIEANGFTSVPTRSGGEEYNGSLTWGKSWDRGHILLAGDYYKRKELARGQRKYLQCEEDYVFTDESHKTRADLVDPRTGEYRCGGLPWGQVWTYDYSYYYSPNGSNIPGSQGVGDVTLFQYNYPGSNLGRYIPGIGPRTTAGQIAVPEGWYPVGYDPASIAVQNSYHPYVNQDTVIPQTERYTLYADGAFKVSDAVEVYGEFLFNRRKTYQNGSRQIWQFGYGEYFDYVDADGNEGGFAGNPLAQGWGGAALFSPTGYTNLSDNSQRVDYYRGLFGVRGDIGKGFSYDVYGQYSKSKGIYRSQQILADSMAYPYGDSRDATCADMGNPVTPIGGKQCVDVRWYDPYFLAGELTPEEVNFLSDWEEGKTTYTQKYVEAIVTNPELLTLPAGPVGIAIGATYREDRINDTPGAITLADNAWGSTGAGITAGKTQTTEAFGEVRIPILADIPFFKNLEFSGAARVTNVKAIRSSDGFSDSDNGNWTYKLGLNWQVNDWLRLRSTYGTSFRAPALFEQFLADQTSFLSQRQIDPCIQWGTKLADGAISQQFADNCAADGVAANYTGAGTGATIVTGGGIGLLKPETSKAFTGSVILTPRFSFLPDTRFSLAVDYFDIEVNGEIAQLGAGNILSQCYNSDFYPTDPLCSYFTRNDDVPGSQGNGSNVNTVRDSFINVNSQRNRGIDATLRITHEFTPDVKLTLQSEITWQLKDTTALFDGLYESSNGEAGDPKWTGDFKAILDWRNVSFFYGLTMIGGTDNRPDFLEDGGSICDTATAYPDGRCVRLTTPAWFQHNASVTWNLDEDKYAFTLGVTNFTNAKPPRISVVGGNGADILGNGVFYSQYDMVGRRFFASVKAKY
ncbi:TonB-dependent receptor [Novosphingobium sp. fls2-241-R2A-195]|uniref:TonB-dependent receptor domain-containing protein n=1 Tax=Novosphingobium sp. fls2-241-R2A-195 TaxID=3040296 RepID=UPI00254D78D6|nr:TonB-dependent receptor [Novosphingobium sp. fls2-241-R2A-195]